MERKNHAGGCYCGQVRYVIAGEVRSVCFCHCESCRRASGAPLVAWGTVAKADFKITRGTVSTVRLRAEVERGFCANCGSNLTYAHAGRAGEIDFTLASLDDPATLVPDRHLWVQDKLPWVHIDDGLPQHATLTGG